MNWHRRIITAPCLVNRKYSPLYHCPLSGVEARNKKYHGTDRDVASLSTSRSSPVSPHAPLADFPATDAENLPAANPAGAQTTQPWSQHEAQALATELSQLTIPEEEGDREREGGVHDDAESISTSSRLSQQSSTSPNTMSLAVRKPGPPHLTLGQPVDTGIRVTQTKQHLDTPDKHDSLNKPLPRSPPPSSKLGTFFGWPSPASASTEFSDKEYSPLPSPYLSKATADSAAPDATPIPRHSRASTTTNEADESPLDYCEAYLQTPSYSPTTSDQIEEMEDELKAISAELASSIRREMDLEDLVDRLQEQVNNPQLPGRRTSDYFSDSGYSSAKFSEYDQAKEEILQIQRRAEQEKAQIRLELVEKLQDERDRRRQLDQQILELSERASQVDLARANDQGAMGDRIRELETVCEDLRRKLSEERQIKDNFEDLLGALKGELNTASNERDNLRDEIVPQLRARVEGLEAQAAENSRSAYDTTKIQQELQSLKDENSQLKQLGTRKSQEIKTLRSETTELRQLGSRKSVEIRSLKNEFTDLKQSANRGSMGLSRSASVASRPSGIRNRPDRINTLTESPALPSLPSLSRSNTTKQVGQAESREALAERLKDVESQRDALHSALRSLLERQEFQNRENEKRIRALEAERDRILTASPRQSGYEREVSILRDEINLLRRRAEEAIEQKWQVEKGLAGLKMDLDRAETEIAQLRSLLEENDILIPKAYARSSTGSGGSDSSASPVTSASLQHAYEDLQAAYAEALTRIKSLEATASGDERTLLAMQRLEQALAAALTERDLARHDANSYRERVDSLQSSEHAHIAAEQDLADELRDSARRIEELAQRVRSQLATNSALRDRLAQTVTRGEADQRANKERITKMEARLRSLEEQLVAAQTASEERVARHEDDIAKLKEAHAAQLQRLRDNPGALRSPRLLDPNTPRTPSFFFAGQPRSPRLLSVSRPGTSGSASASPSRHSLRRTSSSPADSGDAAEIEVLRAKVRELEAALAIAEAEMQEVIGRMSAAQIEVLNLQEEREEAVRETRRVQKLLEAEQVKAFEQRFRSITEVR